MTTRFLQILVLIAAVSVIYVNYLATTGVIGGITREIVSDRYPTSITPAGYAFSIWGLIYVGVIIFSVYQLFVTNTRNLNGIRVLFVLSCVANIGWIFAWHNEFLGLSLLAMLTLLGMLAAVNTKTYKFKETGEIWFVKAPFSIYFGWISIATVLNAWIFIISLGFTFNENISSIVGGVLLVLITVVGIVVREKLNVALYPLTIAWAITAIAVKQSGETLIVLICAFCLMALIFSSLTFVLRDTKKFK